jgi:hypothetical protein
MGKLDKLDKDKRERIRFRVKRNFEESEEKLINSIKLDEEIRQEFLKMVKEKIDQNIEQYPELYPVEECICGCCEGINRRLMEGQLDEIRTELKQKYQNNNLKYLFEEYLERHKPHQPFQGELIED